MHDRVKLILVDLLVLAVLAPVALKAEGTDTAMVRITVSDPSGAMIPGATTRMKNEETGVIETLATDKVGICVFNALRPGSYAATVEVSGFKMATQEHIVLRVGQQTDLVFKLELGQATQSVVVQGAAPLINTVGAALGTEVTNRYISEMPLLNRSIIGLSFLAPGVTNVTGGDINSYFGGTNFVSNGQRNATAQFNLDGAVATMPEGGEGGTNNLAYLPSVEAVQEFKLQNSSFSAEYGNNGGTVVSMITKSGTNKFHGSGWYFGRRPQLDAQEFFANSAGEPKGDYAHDQYGGTLGGPIIKQKLFFFADYERTRDNAPSTMTTTVPTAQQKNGDFSQTFNADGSLKQIYNPYSLTKVTDASGNVDYTRAPYEGNVIPQSAMDPIAQKVIALYPAANVPGEPVTGLNNYTFNYVSAQPTWAFDEKTDYYINAKNRLSGRYSMKRSSSFTPDNFLAPNYYGYHTYGGVLEHTWTPTPTLIWENRLGLVRYAAPQHVGIPVDPLSVGFPKILVDNPFYGNMGNFPGIGITGYQGLATDAGETNTNETDTQWSINSAVTKVLGKHNLKFGGERRIYLNNFFQASTSGGFDFDPGQTSFDALLPNSTVQGDGLASFLVGFPDDGSLGMVAAVANKSMETGFYGQDDWKVSRRLTVNLGLRYEWSTPYTERHNRNQFTCDSCDSGIDVPALGSYAGGELYGTSILANSNMRHSHMDMNNLGPRLGLAYGLNDTTVIRAGAGLYYGLDYATNWQYGAAAWNKDDVFPTSLDGGITRDATMENPFPMGFVGPEGGKYGNLEGFGFSDDNHAGLTNRNAEIYQWNFGIQHQFGHSMLIEVNYVGSRSTHLPWGRSTKNQNWVSAANRAKYGTVGLNQLVANPFQYLFQGPNAIFNEPDSTYNDPTIYLVDTLTQHPQFPSDFFSYPDFAASARYNALQVRFEKRYANGLSFTGNYAYSHESSTSDAGANRWVGLISQGDVQDMDDRAAQQSISAMDTPQRLVVAAVYELPLGRGRAFGHNMNRYLDGAIGGWKLNSFLTLQSGQPIDVSMANGRIYYGTQRPNLAGNPCSGASVDQVVNGSANYFNVSAFSNPGDEVDGNSPRYLSDCRAPGIHSLDQGIEKTFRIRENMSLEVRGEFFNFLNTPRFGYPSSGYGSSYFGTISGTSNSPRQGQFGVRFVF